MNKAILTVLATASVVAMATTSVLAGGYTIPATRVVVTFHSIIATVPPIATFVMTRAFGAGPVTPMSESSGDTIVSVLAQ